MDFRLLAKEKVYRGKIIDLTVDRVEYPGGATGIREVVEHPGGAVVVPLFADDTILLVRQYRHPFGKEIVELPAGKLERGEEPLHCAQRELQEETGYRAARWTRLCAMMTTPGFCNEILHLFLAEELSAVPGGQKLEIGEQTLTMLRMPLADAAGMVEEGTINDAKTMAGILLALRRKGR